VCPAAAPTSSNLTKKEAEELAADIKKLEDRESWCGNGQHGNGHSDLCSACAVTAWCKL
jgi:hypothetical protein